MILSAITQTQITVTATEPIRTIADEKQYYRSRRAMAKKFGLEEWFLSEFGTEEEWIGKHFTIKPYDMEANKY
jgi:hypothetical protein